MAPSINLIIIATAATAALLLRTVGATGGTHTFVDVGPFTFQAGHKSEHHPRDGFGRHARFGGLYGCGVDRIGDVFTSSPYSCLIQRVEPGTSKVTTYLGTDCDDTKEGGKPGSNPEAEFRRPNGVATAKDGLTAYLVVGYTCEIMKINLVTRQAHFWAGGGTGNCGYSDALGRNAEFQFPQYMTLNADDTTAWVTEAHRVRKIVMSSISVAHFSGSVSGVSGDVFGTGASATACRYKNPRGIEWVARVSMVFVVDYENFKVKKIAITGGDAGKAILVAGSTSGWNDGIGVNAKFEAPHGTALHPNGRYLFVTDWRDHRVRRVNVEGNHEVVTVFNKHGDDEWKSSIANHNSHKDRKSVV